MDRARKKTRNDLLLIAALLVLACAAGLLILFSGGRGESLRVTVDGEEYGIYSLHRDMTLEIRSGADGQGCNLLVIRDGRAFVESATCPDAICVAHRPISREGESIVCLPNRVVITVERRGAK